MRLSRHEIEFTFGGEFFNFFIIVDLYWLEVVLTHTVAQVYRVENVA